MKLSFAAFIIAVLAQPSFGEFDCSICDELYNNDPTIPTVFSLLKGTKNSYNKDNCGIGCVMKNFFVEGKTIPGVERLPNIECWNVRGVTNFVHAFSDAKTWSGDLNCWDTQDATNMEYTFYDAQAFNGSLNGWNTRKVTNFALMFAGSRNFNQPVNSFDTSRATNIQDMFYSADAFNQPLSHFDTSSVTDMHYMFLDADSFNQDISSWDVSKVTDFRAMFQNAKAFNQPLANWDIGSIATKPSLSNMFYAASAFNQCLAPWAGKIPKPNELLKPLYLNMFVSSGCPVEGDPATDSSTQWNNVWCSSECSTPYPTPNPTLNPTLNPTQYPTSALGRFEISHREGIGNIHQVEPELKASILFKAGQLVTKEKLAVELYGMAEKDNDAACSDGVLITDTDILTINDISLDTGIASFDLNLKRTTDAQKVTDGSKVDVCARIVFEDSGIDVLTNLDTRFQINRTYESEVGGVSFNFNVGDPSTNSIGENKVTNVAVSSFFCHQSKDPLEANDKEFKPGQDVRVCLQPSQDNNSNFQYAITNIKDVKCSVSEDSSFDIKFGGRNEIHSEPNDEGTISFVFVLMDSLLVDLDGRELDCKGTAVLSSTRNDGNRFLQTTSSEDVEFDITLIIAEDDDSVGATIGTTFAMALLGAVTTAHL